MNLNRNQQLAVDNIDGPMMVIAGPGTGKTQVISQRIKSILEKTDTEPQNILALTFTEAAATNMRLRLKSLIGQSAYQVRIETFHAFCNDIISSQSEFFEMDNLSAPVSDLEVIEFLKKYLDNPKLQYLRTPKSAHHYIYAIRQALQNIKREGVTREKFQELIAEDEKNLSAQDLTDNQLLLAKNKVGRQKELSDLYFAYQKFLNDKKRYDYDDMILLTIEALENHEELKLEIQEKIHYFLVDEYQDTNSAQNKVLDLLTDFWGENANVFVVGDPNQTIYRFQVASSENVLGFIRRYPQAQIISLEEGYRCTEQIYFLASQILSLRKSGRILSESLESLLDKQLVTEKFGEKVEVLEFPDTNAEYEGVIDKIKKLIKTGAKPSEIAVLFKKNQEVVDFAQYLRPHQINFILSKKENILESLFIQQIINILATINDIASGQEAYLLPEILFYDYVATDKLEVLELVHASSKAKPKKDLYTFIKDSHPKQGALFGSSLMQFIDILEALAIESKNKSMIELFPLVLEKIGLTQKISSHSLSEENITDLTTLFAEIKSWSKSHQFMQLARFLEIINSYQSEHLSIDKDVEVGSEGIELTTAHKAKGREWQYVFIFNCIDKVWGNARTPSNIALPSGILSFEPIDKQSKNEDELRLFYVSLTRAKQQAFVSYSLKNREGDRDQVMSQFVNKILEFPDYAWLSKEDGPKSITGNNLFFVPHNYDQSFTNYLQKIIATFKLSPTALDSYLKDPQDFLLNNLLRIPRAKTIPLIYGSAIHKTLEKYFSQLMKTSQAPSATLIKDFFLNSLSSENLSATDLELNSKQGLKVLDAYLSQVKVINPIKATEYNFGIGSRLVVLGDISLTGKVDRIDKLDQLGQQLKVIDYKTGRPKSRQSIEKGDRAYMSEREKTLPEHLRSSYKRQLLFYKLLSELDPSFKGTVAVGELDFVESYLDSKNGKLEFELKQNEVDDLKELIKEVMGEIRELQFLYLQDAKAK